MKQLLSAVKFDWEVVDTLNSILRPFRAFEPAFKEFSQLKEVDKAGFLPHYTTSAECLKEDVRGVAPGRILTEHYRNNWRAIKERFKDHITKFPVEDETKSTFNEALKAHDLGLYRAVTRMLFPEIERVYRAELKNGVFTGLTGLRSLREDVLDCTALELSHYTPIFNYYLLEKLIEHVYSRVESDDGLVKIRLDPVPDRHAAMHGLIVYSSLQSSINMIIMAEFFFQLFTRLN